MYTVWMKSLIIFAGVWHLLFQYRSDFALFLALYNLVIEVWKVKRGANKIKKNGTTWKNTRKFAHFYESVKFIIGPKVLVICTISLFTLKYIFEFVWWIVTKKFKNIFSRRRLYSLRSLSCFNPFFLLIKYKHKQCKDVKAMVYKIDCRVLNN